MVAVCSRQLTACCPSCGSESGRTHGGYRRTLADAPVGGRRVCLMVRVRRFRCANPECAAVTFVEQIPGLSTPFARRTEPATRRLVALALAGRAGARLALGWRGSIQTVRRFLFPLRGAPVLPPPPPPRARDIVRWIMTDPDHLTVEDTLKLKDVRIRCPELDALAGHVTTFATMLCQLTGHDFLT